MTSMPGIRDTHRIFPHDECRSNTTTTTPGSGECLYIFNIVSIRQWPVEFEYVTHAIKCHAMLLVLCRVALTGSGSYSRSYPTSLAAVFAHAAAERVHVVSGLLERSHSLFLTLSFFGRCSDCLLQDSRCWYKHTSADQGTT
jgi:hypothetical protein